MKLASLLMVGMIVLPATRTVDIPTHCLMDRVAAQQGNPGHQRPPEGWNCNQDKKDDHQCTCHRECKDEEDTDQLGEPNGHMVTRVKEDPNCRVFCFKDHCMCPIHNCD